MHAVDSAHICTACAGLVCNHNNNYDLICVEDGGSFGVDEVKNDEEVCYNIQSSVNSEDVVNICSYKFNLCYFC